MLEPLWTTEQAAEYLSVPVATINKWVYKRSIPFRKVGRLTRFSKAELDKWSKQAYEESQARLQTIKEGRGKEDKA